MARKILSTLCCVGFLLTLVIIFKPDSGYFLQGGFAISGSVTFTIWVSIIEDAIKK